MERLKTIWNDFSQDEDGAALTEYVVLLGLLVSGVAATVLAFGGTLNNVWAGFNTWLADEVCGNAVSCSAEEAET